MATWIDHALWWQVYPLGFLGADPRGERRTPTRTLDGIADWLDYAVELGASGLALGPIFQSSTHGYDTTDHFAIDERLGDEASFLRLVEQCRRRGLRLLLDGVFNHVGTDFSQQQWFIPVQGGGYQNFEGHPGLITLNHFDAEVADYVTSVMTYWLDRGADGWRLDAAYAVPRVFWAQTLPRVRERHPGAYFVGEVIHGDYSAIVRESTMDAVTQYELWKALWSSVNDRNFFELSWALKRLNADLATFVPFTFAGNHDVTRIASRIEDPRHLGHVLAVLFTIAGTPCVYYGDEQGFTGVKEDRAGGDDIIRPAFPASGPEGLAPYGWPTYRLHQDLIGFRRRHPWLNHAHAAALTLTNSFFSYECRTDGQSIVVALNLGESEQHTEIPVGIERVLEAPGISGARITARQLNVPAHQWAIGYSG